VTSQAQALALQPAKLLAVNVNGLAGKNKRRAFFKHVLSTSWYVLVLSETHCGGPDVAAKWLRGGAGPGKPWLGQAFWSHGTSASRGVAVLLRQGFAAKAKIEFADTAGRVLRVGWDSGPQGRPVSVVAVYAPADAGEASRSAFFAPDGPLQQAIAAGSGSAADLFLGGDFNCRLPVGESVGAQPADVQRLQGLVAGGCWA
jgi:exonuclease III